MKKLEKIWNGFTTVLVLLVVVLAVLLAGVRLIGLTPFTVLSGSMEPAYHVGSLIYVRKTPPEDIQVDDVITYVVNEDLLVSTHRVVAVDVAYTKTQAMLDDKGNPAVDEYGMPLYEEVPLEEPSYYYTTKGDANTDVDGAPVYYKNVLGVPVFSIPLLGYLSSWLQSRQGTILGVTFALVIIILTFLPDLLKLVDEPQQKERKGNDASKAEEIEEDASTGNEGGEE